MTLATADKAKTLASTRNWRELAGNPSLVWGECKSSGLTYYKSAYQLKSQSFTCNCSSRKYPCKHAVALSMLLSQQPDAFQLMNESPDWVKDWIEKGMPTGKTDTPEEEKAKEELREKNFSKRLLLMAAGLNELENWLTDTIRQGIATLDQHPYSFWKEISARMYDAKLSAIGKRLKKIPILIGSNENWPEKVLEELTSYYLLIRGLRKMEELPLNVQQDLLSFAGVTTRKEELFQYGQMVKDTWMVMGQVEGVEDKLNYRRTWIYGYQTAHYGLILDFAFGNNPYPANYTKGTVFDGSVVYYPSNARLRVAVKEKLVLDRTIKRIIGFQNFADYLDFYATNLAANPWQIFFPCSIQNLTPVLEKEQLLLIDNQNKVIPVMTHNDIVWKILATSGGHPINVFGEWSGDKLLPLSITIEDKFISL